MSKSIWKLRVAGNPPGNTNVTTTLPTGLGQADTTLELPRPLATETWVRHKTASKKTRKLGSTVGCVKRKPLQSSNKEERPQSILPALLFFAWPVTDYGLYLPVTQAKRYPSTVADTASNKSGGEGKGWPQQSHLSIHSPRQAASAQYYIESGRFSKLHSPALPCSPSYIW